MKFRLLCLLAFALLSRAAVAAPETFDFKDPTGVNSATFKLVAPLETITGTATGISGTVTFDPANPAATQGRIVVTSASLRVPNPLQNEHLHGAQWLNAAQYPDITFEAKELKNPNTTSNVISADAVGTFTLKGVSKELTVPVTLTYLKDKLGEHIRGKEGDLLVIRANFHIQRRDFNLMAGQMENKVSDTIELTVGIAGAAPK